MWIASSHSIKSKQTKNFEFDKVVVIVIKLRKQVASHAGQPVRNTELCNYNTPVCNCYGNSNKCSQCMYK